MITDRAEYMNLSREVWKWMRAITDANESVGLLPPDHAPEFLRDDLDSLRAYERDDPYAVGAWEQERERLRAGLPSKFESKDDVRIRAHLRRIEAEWELSGRDLLMVRAVLDKVIESGLNEILMSRTEGAERTGLHRSSVRRALASLSEEGHWFERRRRPKMDVNRLEWARQRSKNGGLHSSAYFVVLDD